MDFTKFKFLMFSIRTILLIVFLYHPITYAKDVDANSTNSKAVQETVLPLDDVRRFTTSIEHVKNYYVESVGDKKLFEDAIRGMLQGLDPHSAYLDENDFAELRASTSGEFGGLGLEVTGEDGYVKVITPIDDTPASKAGIKTGDFIVRIDKRPVKGMSLAEAVKLMRGQVGTTVQLTIVRKSTKKTHVFNLVRDNIQIKSVKSRMLEPGFGYIRISVFQRHSADELNSAIKKLQQQSNGQLKGLVLDLRNNPGGLLESSVAIADTFLDLQKLKNNKLIVYTRGRIPEAQVKHEASGSDILKGVPLVVLINEGSASASEIVAGALQDHKRALIVGKTSFGKGSVQTVLPLDEKTAIKLTTARYYTPNGRSIQAEGIVPDVKVDDLIIPQDKKDSESNLESLKESDLSGHLINEGKNRNENKNIKEPIKKMTSEEDVKNNQTIPGKDSDNKKPGAAAVAPITNEDENKPLIYKDYQLHEALSLLKGIVVAQHHSTNVIEDKKTTKEQAIKQ